MKNRLGQGAAILLVILCPLAARPAAAQSYPTRPITIVVANSPGDQEDLGSRLLAPEMSKVLGQPVIVENKPGAGTLLGFTYVAKLQPADGYTMAAASDTALLILPLTTKNVQFDPIGDLPPFIEIEAGKLVLTSPINEPWNSFDELIAYAKAHPGQLNYGSSSSTTRLLTELLLRGRDARATYVPYSSVEKNFAAELAGETQIGIMPERQALGAKDKLKILGQTGTLRSPNLPDVPTFAELGFPTVPDSTYSLNLRGGTPKPIVEKLHDAVAKALDQRNVKAGLARLFVNIPPPESSEQTLDDQTKLALAFKNVAQQIGLQPQ